MTNILIVSCIHNDIENILLLLEKVSSLKFDVVVCPGDFTDLSIPKGFTRADVGRLIIEELKSLNRPLVTVPGSWDKELIELLEKETISVHGNGSVVSGIGFYGYGGARTPFGTPFEPSDEEIKNGLEKAFTKLKKTDVRIQVTHMPPARSKVDVIFSGAHVGSEVVRDFIVRNQPAAAVCAHIHESKGVDTLGETKIINSGRFPEGNVGLVTVDGKEISAKVVSLI